MAGECNFSPMIHFSWNEPPKLTAREERKRRNRPRDWYYVDGLGVQFRDGSDPKAPKFPVIKEHIESMPVDNPITSIRPAVFNESLDKRRFKASIFRVDEAVVSVSVFSDTYEVMHCSGFVLHWDDKKHEATILTTARLLKYPHDRTSRCDYDLIVRLKDGTILSGREEYVDFYHNLMTLKVTCDKKPHTLELKDESTIEKMSVIAVGRELYESTLEASGGEVLLGYPCYGCQEILRTTCNISQLYEGGPVISYSGEVVGISFYDSYSYILPTSVVVACMSKYWSNRIVLQPWTGLRVIDSEDLEYGAWQKLNLTPSETCVVVQKVFENSPASEVKVCPGDSILCCIGEPVRSAKQYSEMLDALSYKWKDRKSIKVVLERLEDKEEVDIEVKMLPSDDRIFCAMWAPEDRGRWLCVRR